MGGEDGAGVECGGVGPPGLQRQLHFGTWPVSEQTRDADVTQVVIVVVCEAEVEADAEKLIKAGVHSFNVSQLVV